MTDNIYCLVMIIAKDDRNIAAVQFKIKLVDVSTSLNGSLIAFIRTYTIEVQHGQTPCSYEHYLV